MRIVQETTVWPGNNPNHIYVLDDANNNAIAYVPAGSKDVVKFSKPLKMDWRGRSFKELKSKAEPKTQVVEGSKGEQYYVTEEDGVKTCSCPGFKYRGKCKHIAA